MVPSMSRKGNCYENAPMGDWISTIESELRVIGCPKTA
jgi:hypothetical protein